MLFSSKHNLASQLYTNFQEEKFGKENFGESLTISQIRQNFSLSKILYCIVLVVALLEYNLLQFHKQVQRTFGKPELCRTTLDYATALNDVDIILLLLLLKFYIKCISTADGGCVHFTSLVHYCVQEFCFVCLME